MPLTLLRISVFFVLALFALWYPQRSFEQIEFELAFNSTEPIQVKIGYGDGEDFFRFQNEDVLTRAESNSLQTVSGHLPPIPIESLRFSTSPTGEIGKLRSVRIISGKKNLLLEGSAMPKERSGVRLNKDALASLEQKPIGQFPPIGMLYLFALCISILLEKITVVFGSLSFRRMGPKRCLSAASIFLLIIATSFAIGRPSYRPFSIRVNGNFQGLTLPQSLKLHFDTGESYNELETINVILADEPMKLKIRNITPEGSGRKGKEVHFIAGNFDGAIVGNESITPYGNARLHNGHYLLAEEKSEVSFGSNFSYAQLTFVNHPYSGIAALAIGNQDFAEIDLFSSSEAFATYHYVAASSVSDESFLIELPNRSDNIRFSKLKLSGPTDLIERVEDLELFAEEHSALRLDLEKYVDSSALQSKNLPEDWNASFSRFQLSSSIVLAVVCGIFLVAFPIPWGKLRKTLPAFTVFFVPLAIAQLTYLFAFYPGSMTHDSFESFSQILGETQRNYQPFFYLFYLRLMSGFGNSIAIVGAIQGLLTAMLLAAFFTFCIREGCPKFLILIAYLFVLLSPVVGLYSITLWKDVPYALVLVAVGFLIYLLTRQRCRFGDDVWSSSLVPLVVFFVAFAAGLRPPALFVVAVISVAFWLSRAFSFKETLLFFSSVVGIFAIGNYFLAFPLGAHQNTNYQKLWSIPSIVLASHLVQLDNLEEGLSSPPLTTLVELDDLKRENVGVLFTPRFNPFLSSKEKSALNTQVKEAFSFRFWELLNRIIERNWMVLTGQGYRWDNGWLRNREWKFWKQSATYYSSDFTDQGIGSEGVSWLRSDVDEAVNSKASSLWGSIAFNAVFQFAALVVCCLLFPWFPGSALFSLVVLAPLATFFVLVPTLEFRYLYPIYLGGVLAPLLLYLEFKGAGEAKN